MSKGLPKIASFLVKLALVCFVFVTLAAGQSPAKTTQAAAARDSDVVAPVRGMVEHATGRFGDWLARHTGAWGRATFLHIALWRYLATLILLALTFLAARMVRVFLEKYLLALAAKTRWDLDDLLFEMAGRPASLAVTSLGLYGATLPVILVFPAGLRLWYGRICLAVAVAAIFWYFYRVVDVIDRYLRRWASRTENEIDDTFAEVVRKTLRVFIVVVAVLFIGQTVLQLNITALLASAGIAGLAIALAAQDTLANFLGSFMMLVDRPFRVGERVKVNDADGVVEELGFRSTRIRTLEGHLVSIPNKQVADSRIENIGRRPYIRRVATFGVTYDTPLEKVRRAVEIIREVLDKHGHMHPDYPPRVHFVEYGDWSLNIRMMAWFAPPDYWEYLAWCERVNFDIMQRFAEEGIEFAFPTNTTYLAHDAKRALHVAVADEAPHPHSAPETPAAENR